MAKTIHSNSQEKFCSLLRLERKKAMLSQADLALRLGKPQSFVSNYERGERRLDVLEFISVAKVIGFDPKRIIAELEG